MASRPFFITLFRKSLDEKKIGNKEEFRTAFITFFPVQSIIAYNSIFDDIWLRQ